MNNAFILAGFKVVSTPALSHDLVAKIALAVREESGKVYQTYRCGLRAPDGTLVAVFEIPDLDLEPNIVLQRIGEVEPSPPPVEMGPVTSFSAL